MLSFVQIILSNASRKEKYSLIDLAIPTNDNRSEKKTEKLAKHEYSVISITKMYGMKQEQTPIITDNLEFIKRFCTMHNLQLGAYMYIYNIK